jgi:hypothetical protein
MAFGLPTRQLFVGQVLREVAAGKVLIQMTSQLRVGEDGFLDTSLVVIV